MEEFGGRRWSFDREAFLKCNAASHVVDRFEKAGWHLRGELWLPRTKGLCGYGER